MTGPVDAERIRQAAAICLDIGRRGKKGDEGLRRGGARSRCRHRHGHGHAALVTRGTALFQATVAGARSVGGEDGKHVVQGLHVLRSPGSLE
jgi:hypothetical protein